MNCISALRAYVESILMSVTGPKILLLDNETTSMIGLVYTQTELLSHDVVLIETLKQVHDKPFDKALAQIQCIALIRPVLDEIKLELQAPHFGNYYLFFTNILNETLIRELAQSDHNNKVMVVHEVFMDYYALNRRIYSFGMRNSLNDLISRPSGPKMQRMIDGIFSILGSMRLRSNIKYDATSPLAKALAEQLNRHMSRKDVYFQKSEPATLFILDRRTDPITPMLHGWSYLELLHETMGIHNNIVDIKEGNSVKQYVVDERMDSFLAANLTLNYASLTDAVRALSDEVKQQPKPSLITDIDALKSYIQKYPTYQEKSNLAVKHVSLMTAASQYLKNNNILPTIGTLEQDIAVNSSQSSALNEIMQLIDKEPSNPEIERLCLLFASKYETSDSLNQLKNKLSSVGTPYFNTILRHIDSLLRMTGQSFIQRDSNLAGSILSFFSNIASSSNDHPLMRYHPPLEEIISSLKKGKLPNGFQSCGGPEEISRKLIFFFIGGTTYAEGKLAYLMSDKDFDIIIGGTTVHNLESFISDVSE